jgi:uncharacterized protein
MKIAVEKIKDQEVIGREDISACLWDMDSADVKFIGNIHLDCSFLRVDNEIIVSVKVGTHRIITCSRCLEQAVQKLEQHFDLNYQADNLSDYLEVDKDIREEILLNFPMKVLCKDDCKGLCPHCGMNLNFGGCDCKVKIGNKPK